MKLLLVITYYYPHWTGLTQYAKALAESLDKKMFSVSVLAYKHELDLREEEEISDVRVIRIPAWFRLSRTMVSPLWFAVLWRQMAGCDKVVAFTPQAEVAAVAVMAWVWRKPFWLIHNGDLVLPKGVGNRILEKIFYMTTSLAISLSRGVIVNTKDYATHSALLKKFPKKWIELRPPFPPLEPKSKIEKQINSKLKGFKHRIGFSGRWVEEKGFDILLKAVPLVTCKIPNTGFVFAGETNITYENFYKSQENIIKRLEPNLVMLGKLEHEDMGAFYKACDVLVVSSRSDFFPFVQAEAMLAGGPVVVTDIPGARQPVIQTGMGVVVAKESPTALAEGILEVLRNKKRFTVQKEKVKKYFDYPSTIQKYESLLI